MRGSGGAHLSGVEAHVALLEALGRLAGQQRVQLAALAQLQHSARARSGRVGHRGLLGFQGVFWVSGPALDLW